MKTTIVALTVALCVFAVSEATQVRSCSNDQVIQDSDFVHVSGCEVPPCKLKKKTKINVDFKFKPETEVKSLENSVFAYVLGIPLPFVGVDSTSACSFIFDEAGKPAGCPLKAGTTYFYKNSFDVLEVYPKIKTTVQWALREPSGKDHVCFKVDSRII
ncbi:NPC intracellular cholesterol transporter 2 [Ischnura elegans]|uniref:NPC intracellular cholesterol transporter 2 n=1 Tax=Ischnura elegans TaxID=197161 RepID=UPI001ED87B93|nr:NPC intracellular cholesterol transporter 2 [Ischnura elegans]